MKLFRNSAISLAIFALAAVLCSCKSDEKKIGPITFQKPADKLEVGIAEVDITAPIGYRMAGYFDERFSTGVHDPLKAKAIVMRQGKQQTAWVFCDLVGVSLKVSKAARARASALTGIPVTNITVFATHSHTGPSFDDVRSTYFHNLAVEKFGRDPHQTIDYSDFLTERIVDAIEAARKKMMVSDVAMGIGHQPDLPFNRRYHMKNGRVAFNPGIRNPNTIGPAGPADHDVGILLFGNPGKRSFVGGLTVFAMHADTTGGSEYSADYPYYIQQGLRDKFGTNFISAFGAGTCGDLNHIDVNSDIPFKGTEMAEHLGTNIAHTVVNSVTNLTRIKRPMLAVRSAKITLPLQEIPPGKLEWAKERAGKMGDLKADFFEKVQIVKYLDLADKGTNWPSEIQVYRLAKDTAVVCLPCEIFVEHGLNIKKQSPFKNTIVISIANDRPSYVPTIKAFKEGSYEITNARVKPGTGEMMVDVAVKLLNELKPTAM